MDFAVRSDVVRIGTDEDGSVREGLVFYVIARAENGRQWIHGKAFPNYVGAIDPEEGPYQRRISNDIPEGAATALCDRITKAVAEGAKLDLAHWTETDPAYGSDAYQSLDEERFFRNREIMDAHEAGEISERTALEYMIM